MEQTPNMPNNQNTKAMPKTPEPPIAPNTPNTPPPINTGRTTQPLNPPKPSIAWKIWSLIGFSCGFLLLQLILYIFISDKICDYYYETTKFSALNTKVLGFAILLVIAAYATIFILERCKKLPVHLLQYLLTGCAVILFHLLLVSFNEHLSFGWSYLIASAMTVGLITFYMSGVLRSNKLALIVGGVIAVLYALVYMLVSIHSVPLLAVSLILFVALAVVMYFTRKMNRQE